MFLRQFFRKHSDEPGWLAVLALPDRVDVAHVRRGSADRPRVAFCDSYRKQDSDSATLKLLCRELRMQSYRCTTLLNPGEYQMLLADAPDVPQEEMKAAMRWRVQDLLDYRVEEATLDMLYIPPEKAGARNRSAYAIAARNDTVQSRMRLFQDAGVPLNAIDIPELAQRNVASLFESDGRGLALLAFDQQGGLITLNCGGELFNARRIDVPLKLLLEATADRQQQYFARIVLELQRSLDHCDRHFSSISVTKLLVPPFPESVPLAAHLAANLTVEVEAFDLAAVMDFASGPITLPPAKQIQWFYALGAALRDEGAAAS